MFAFIDMIIVRPITNILFIIYNLVGDFGLAIILFTILVKICMWPMMKRQLHQTKLMRKLQPEIVKIKQNCKGNRQLESLQTMDLYKRYNVKPFRSILSLLIQFPIFIALYTAIRVMVIPTTADNLEIRAYPFVQTSQVAEVISEQQECLGTESGCIKGNYNFHPQLFGLVNLDAKVTDVFDGETTVSAVLILAFTLAAAYTQSRVLKQQAPSNQSMKKKSFRDLVKEAADGKEPDQSEINAAMTGQMSTFMPIMLLIIMIPLPGALVFYYLLINLINIAQQKIIFKKDADEMEVAADKEVIKKLNKIQEAEVIQNKKSGTKITRISAKDNKKRRKK